MRASTSGQPTAVVLIPLHDFHDQNNETEGYTTGTPTTQTHWDHQYWYFQVTDFLLNSHLVPNAPHMSNIYVFMYGQKPTQQNPLTPWPCPSNAPPPQFGIPSSRLNDDAMLP